MEKNQFRQLVFAKGILYSLIISFFMFFICFFSCNGNKKKENTKKEKLSILINEWTGKTIQLPNIKPIVIILDSVERIVIADKKYRILQYIDSTGCTSCKLQLRIWKRYMEEINSKADFMFYFHPKTNTEELSLLFSAEEFSQPVYIDVSDSLNKLNRFPDNPTFQCFLLDRENKVVAIGNPAHNLKIWELYKKIIME
jgi:hypothetical protein